MILPGPNRRAIARGYRLVLILSLLGLCLGTALVAVVHAQPKRTLLYGAWTPDEIGLLGPSGVPQATRKGFDLRLLDAIGARAEIGFVLVAMERTQIDTAISSGAIDFALPEIAVPLPDTVLSDPYHVRADLLFMAAAAPRLNGTGIDALKDALARGLRIGVTESTRHGETVTALLKDPRHARQVTYSTRVNDNLHAVLAGRLDGFLAVRIKGLEAVAAHPDAVPHMAILTEPVARHGIHLRFNQAHVSPEIIARINHAIASLRADGEHKHLLGQSTAPVLLRLASATHWFNVIELGGIIAFALSGVMIARREAYSLLGAFVLAVLPALGGGIMRDMLVGRSPIGILASPVPLMLVIGTVASCYALFRVLSWVGLDWDRLSAWEESRTGAGQVISFRNLYEITDALGLAALTVIGVAVAVRFWAEPLWLWGPLCAGVTGAGGGILRDVLRGDSRNPALRTSFYAEICILWGLGLSLVVDWLAQEEWPELLRAAVVVTVLGGFLTRLFVLYFRINSPRI